MQLSACPPGAELGACDGCAEGTVVVGADVNAVGLQEEKRTNTNIANTGR